MRPVVNVVRLCINLYILRVIYVKSVGSSGQYACDRCLWFIQNWAMAGVWLYSSVWYCNTFFEFHNKLTSMLP